MKKTIIALMVALSLFLIANAQAAQASEQESYIVKSTISHIEYDFETKAYIGISNKDTDGGSWTIHIVSKPYKADSLAWLNKHYADKGFTIQYEGNVQQDDVVEITGFWWTR